MTRAVARTFPMGGGGGIESWYFPSQREFTDEKAKLSILVQVESGWGVPLRVGEILKIKLKIK